MEERPASSDSTPPYEDIAFRIVNREWERSHKKGFKFERGILRLYFNFKRYRYLRSSRAHWYQSEPESNTCQIR